MLVSERSRADVDGASVRGTASSGFALTGSCEATITSCDVDAAGGDGVHVGDSSSLTVTDGRFRSGQASGALIEKSARAEVLRSEFTGNGADGLCVRSAEPVAIRECSARDNAGNGLRRTVSSEALTVEGFVSEGNGDTAPGEQPSSADGVDDGDASGPMRDLTSLVGLEGVKREVTTLVNLNKMAAKRKNAGLSAPPMSRHLVFAGTVLDATGAARATVGTADVLLGAGDLGVFTRTESGDLKSENIHH